jgi:hypothetical protein
MSILIEGALLIEAVTLLILTILVTTLGVMLCTVLYTKWKQETGGMKALSGDVVKFFRRVRQADGSFNLVPYDEVDEDPLREKKDEEEEKVSWEDDYADGLDLKTKRRFR